MDEIIAKVRALVSDLVSSDYQVFTFVSSAVFKIALPNATATAVLVNGSASGVTYTYDSTDQEVTVTSSLTAGDVVQVNFSYYSYSDTEIIGYIRGALVYLSVQSSDDSTDYEIEDDEDIYPTPSNKDEDVISLIASILIKPDYVVYKTSTLEVRYPRNMDKDTKIEKLITKYNWGLGNFGIIYLD